MQTDLNDPFVRTLFFTAEHPILASLLWFLLSTIGVIIWFFILRLFLLNVLRTHRREFWHELNQYLAANPNFIPSRAMPPPHPTRPTGSDDSRYMPRK